LNATVYDFGIEALNEKGAEEMVQPRRPMRIVLIFRTAPLTEPSLTADAVRGSPAASVRMVE
jgi:hypothetical protein